MEIAMVGLGKMGGNMAERLVLGGHRVIVTDVNPDAVAEAISKGSIGASSLEEVVSTFESSPRVVWVMVPAGDLTQSVIDQLADLLDAGDIIIDGGNSNFNDTKRRAKELAEKHGVSPKRAASILDIFACIIQGLIPYGAQALLIASTFGITPVAVIMNGWYCMILAVVAVVIVTVRQRKA